MGHDQDYITRRAYEDPTIWTETLGPVQPHAPGHLPGGGDPIDLAKTSAAGLMAGADKAKLDRLSDAPGVESHEELQNVSADQHIGHAQPETKTWNGTETAWNLAKAPTHGVTLHYKRAGSKTCFLMDPDTDYTLVGAVITPAFIPGSGDKTRVEAYFFAGSNV